jgi:hypothetical protein
VESGKYLDYVSSILLSPSKVYMPRYKKGKEELSKAKQQKLDFAQILEKSFTDNKPLDYSIYEVIISITTICNNNRS